MLIELNYPDDVIVLIKNKNIFKWYVSEKELWIMDLEKLSEDLDKKLKALGKEISQKYIDKEREGLEILNQTNIDVFEVRMKEYKVTYQDLKNYFESNLEQSYYKKSNQVCPDFYIDFDMKIYYSCFTEPGSYEYYIPDDWKGIVTNQISEEVMIQARSA